jgi:cytochrome o ubiquinol oxidase subunit 2
MKTGKKFVPLLLFFTAVILLIFLIMQPLMILNFWNEIAVLFPRGKIALEERNLLFIIQGIMLIIMIPVFILTFIFSWKYNIYHPKEKYDPDLIDNRLAEYIWWGVPCFLTLIIAILTWVKTHELDPYKKIQSDKKPITIQVIALQWKWLYSLSGRKDCEFKFFTNP